MRAARVPAGVPTGGQFTSVARPEPAAELRLIDLGSGDLGPGDLGPGDLGPGDLALIDLGSIITLMRERDAIAEVPAASRLDAELAGCPVCADRAPWRPICRFCGGEGVVTRTEYEEYAAERRGGPSGEESWEDAERDDRDREPDYQAIHEARLEASYRGLRPDRL